jgi:hypothetical protein
MADAGLGEVEVSEQDGPLWERQRTGQRSADAALVKVAVPPGELASVLGAAETCGGTVVGRAALGTCFVEVEPGAVQRLCELLAPRAPVVILDAPDSVRSRLDPWGAGATPRPAELELMRRIKARFDPAGTCNPGLFVGGI